ncbi:MAG: hypothetical protein HY898_28665 [Deltaproteobacteria bacterium]|nr:hypothetical protein [Deltaproteobacteria bacterium]
MPVVVLLPLLGLAAIKDFFSKHFSRADKCKWFFADEAGFRLEYNAGPSYVPFEAITCCVILHNGKVKRAWRASPTAEAFAVAIELAARRPRGKHFIALNRFDQPTVELELSSEAAIACAERAFGVLEAWHAAPARTDEACLRLLGRNGLKLGDWLLRLERDLTHRGEQGAYRNPVVDSQLQDILADRRAEPDARAAAAYLLLRAGARSVASAMTANTPPVVVVAAKRALPDAVDSGMFTCAERFLAEEYRG